MCYEVMQKWKEYGSDVQFYEVPGNHCYIEDDGVREGICTMT